MRAGLAQMVGVGMGLLCALFLTALAFLSTGQGDEVQALAIFAAWFSLFFLLVWRADTWRRVLARGLLAIGLEFLALPLAWLFNQGLPLLSPPAPQMAQTLPVLALGLSGAVVFCGAGLAWLLRLGLATSPAVRALLAAIGVVAAGEALYGLFLLYAGLVS